MPDSDLDPGLVLGLVSNKRAAGAAPAVCYLLFPPLLVKPEPEPIPPFSTGLESATRW